jgi:hypothetical protein
MKRAQTKSIDDGAALATLTFEPWDRSFPYGLPSNKSWLNPTPLTIRLAGAAMCLSKAEHLQNWKNDPELQIEFLKTLKATQNELKAMLKLVEGAEAGVVAGEAACH